LGIGFAIPIKLGKQVLEEITKYGRLRAAWPGMQVQEVTEFLARRLGYTDVGGLVITRVEPGGPADKAGLNAADRIRKVNGLVVNTFDDVQRSIYGASVGDRLALNVQRGDKHMDVSLTLVEAPR